MSNLLSLLSPLFHNSPVVLYILQAGTYGAAAAFIRRDDHGSLTKCYWASALLHGLLAACHLMHLG